MDLVRFWLRWAAPVAKIILFYVIVVAVGTAMSIALIRVTKGLLHVSTGYE